MSKRFYLLSFLILFLLGSLAFAAKRTLISGDEFSISDEQKKSIKVLLMDNSNEINIAGLDLHVSGADIDMDFPGDKKLKITYKKGNRWVLIGNGNSTTRKKYVSSLLKITSPAGFIRVKSIPFAGNLEIQRSLKGLSLVNEVSMERYLVGVLMKEMKHDWEVEAMKSLAVAARTYAIKKSKQAQTNKLGYDIRASFLDQAYGGGVSMNDQRAVKAVRDTANETLVVNNELFDAYYHSECGGRTELPSNVWGDGNNLNSYARSVKCPYCEPAPDFIWRFDITSEQLEEVLKESGYSIHGVKSIHVNAMTQTSRVDRLHIVADKGSFFITAQKLREVVGFNRIRSTTFNISQKDGFITLIGKGSGHGVGLCQWGAKGMASHGLNYKQILSHYYPAAKIKKQNYEKSRDDI